MNAIKQWIEDHPYLSGSIVLGILVLYLISSRSSSAASSTASGVAGTGLSSSDYTSLQEAGIASANNQATLQAQSTAQVNNLNAELAAAQITAATTDTQNQLAAAVALQQTLSTQDTTNQKTQAETQVALAQTGAQVSIAQIAANEQQVISGGQQQTLQMESQNQLLEQQGIDAATVAQSTATSGVFSNITNLIAQIFSRVNTPPSGAATTPGMTSAQPIGPAVGPIVSAPVSSPVSPSASSVLFGGGNSGVGTPVTPVTRSTPPNQVLQAPPTVLTSVQASSAAPQQTAYAAPADNYAPVGYVIPGAVYDPSTGGYTYPQASDIPSLSQYLQGIGIPGLSPTNYAGLESA